MVRAHLICRRVVPGTILLFCLQLHHRPRKSLSPGRVLVRE